MMNNIENKSAKKNINADGLTESWSLTSLDSTESYVEC